MEQAEKALEQAVEIIYGYNGTYEDQIYNQIHTCIDMIGKRLEKYKPKKGKYHSIFYICFDSNSGMPQSLNTAYTVLTVILNTLHDIEENKITLDEAFYKNGNINSNYLGVGANYTVPKYKAQKQDIKERFNEMFNNQPLNKILERFMGLFENQRASITETQIIDSANDKIEEAENKLKQINQDIKTLKQIKHETGTDESTKEAAKSTIKELKAEKHKIKAKRTQAEKNEIKNKGNILSEKRRQKILLEVMNRIKEQYKERKNAINEEEKNNLTETKDSKPKMTGKPKLEIYRDIMYDSGVIDDLNNWRGYQQELEYVNNIYKEKYGSLPKDSFKVFEKQYIYNLNDQLNNGVINEVKAYKLLTDDLPYLQSEYAKTEANKILSEISGPVDVIDYKIEPFGLVDEIPSEIKDKIRIGHINEIDHTFEPFGLVDKVKSSVGLVPRITENVEDIKLSMPDRIKLIESANLNPANTKSINPIRSSKASINTKSIKTENKSKLRLKPTRAQNQLGHKIDVSVSEPINAYYNPKNSTATIRPVFKAKLTL